MCSETDLPRHIEISIADQTLDLFEGDKCVSHYPVSTAKNGPNELEGSGGTPRGKHIIRAMIGEGAPINSVFIGRRPTGEIYSSQLAEEYPERDWVLSRILWLSGLERGKNRLGRVDTMRRYIYIHGCPDELPMGIPLSHGCIRMRNSDIVELFQQLHPGVRVDIK